MRVRPSLPALFLLFMVTAGLFAMHTTGHASLPGSSAAHMTLGHSQALSGTVARHLMLPMGQPPAVAEVVSLPEGEPMPGMLMAACVAILCGALTAAFALFLLRRLGGSAVEPDWQETPGAQMSRGPPGVRIGLLIADLSVARN